MEREFGQKVNNVDVETDIRRIVEFKNKRKWNNKGYIRLNVRRDAKGRQIKHESRNTLK
jgi:hypothetical protein